jgi:hypothetical protein
MGKSGKGSAFERDISKTLSLWWTNGKRDDVFWRTTSSGARATQRKRTKGLATFGQNGDIQAIDPIGQPLIDLISIEIKRGYSRDTLQEILDKRLAKPCIYEEWFKQASDNQTLFWMLIVKRDMRKPIFFMPRKLGICLYEQDSTLDWFPQMTIRTKAYHGTIMCGTLEGFFASVKQKHILKAHRRCSL